jgi:hypothetical protein
MSAIGNPEKLMMGTEDRQIAYLARRIDERDGTERLPMTP